MNQLRQLVVFFSVLVAVKCTIPELSEDGKKVVQELHNTCIEQTGMDPALIEKFNTDGGTEEKSLRCYMKCFMTETTMMDDNGHFNFEPLAELYSREQYEAGKVKVASCVEKAAIESDLCDKAYSMILCFRTIEPDFKLM